MEDFGSVAAEQAGRVHGVGWFQKRLMKDAACPVCGNDHEGTRVLLDKLASAASDLENRRRAASDAPTSLQREEHDLESKIRDAEERLRDLRSERKELEPPKTRESGQSLEEVYRFVGRVEEAIKNLRQTDDGAELRRSIEALKSRIAVLMETTDEGARRRRLEAARQLFARHVAHYADLLGLARRSDAIDLNIPELSLTFTAHDRGRVDFLWEIGSGANWMGYHVAALLALHELFLARRLSPVPTFLVIDQPSQVYFPAGWPEDGEPVRSHDVQATRTIFAGVALPLRKLVTHEYVALLAVAVV